MPLILKPARWGPSLRKVRTSVCALLLALAMPARAAPRSRAELARLLGSLRVGTPAAEARKLLGPPDDVRDELDPGGISASRTREVWRYGVASHLGTATLGQLHIGEHDRVQYVFGGGGAPPAGFSEDELRRLLTIVDQVPSYQAGASFDPRALIRAVNALQPLGKAGAIAVIREYLRVSSPFESTGREGVFLLLRALFESPDGRFPAMMVGSPTPPVPADATAVPRFPLLLLHDVPLLLVSGYTLAGEAEPPEDDLRWFEEHGQLRGQALQPAPRPLALVAELRASATVDRAMVMNQLMLLVDSVQRDEPDMDGLRFPPGPDADARWQALEARFPAVRWDAALQKYVQRDGSSLPEAVAVIHRRVLWRPALGSRCVFVLERQSSRFVRIEWRIAAGMAATPAVVFELRSAGPRSALLAHLAAEPAAPGSEQVTSQTIQLPAGTAIRVELSGGGAAQRSPIVTP